MTEIESLRARLAEARERELLVALEFAGALAYAVGRAMTYDQRRDAHVVFVEHVPAALAALRAYDAAIVAMGPALAAPGGKEQP